jgi:hypothetical protein
MTWCCRHYTPSFLLGAAAFFSIMKATSGFVCNILLLWCSSVTNEMGKFQIPSWGMVVTKLDGCIEGLASYFSPRACGSIGCISDWSEGMGFDPYWGQSHVRLDSSGGSQRLGPCSPISRDAYHRLPNHQWWVRSLIKPLLSLSWVCRYLCWYARFYWSISMLSASCLVRYWLTYDFHPHFTHHFVSHPTTLLLPSRGFVEKGTPDRLNVSTWYNWDFSNHWEFSTLRRPVICWQWFVHTELGCTRTAN